MTERLVAGTELQEDADVSLRPRRIDDFVGQSHTKQTLQIAIDAAKIRQEPLDHAIIYGPPGLGKTTLSHIIAAEMDVPIRVTSGPAIERGGRHGRRPDQPAARRSAVHRRSSSPESGSRGGSLLGHGGLFPVLDGRQGAGRPQCKPADKSPSPWWGPPPGIPWSAHH